MLPLSAGNHCPSSSAALPLFTISSLSRAVWESWLRNATVHVTVLQVEPPRDQIYRLAAMTRGLGDPLAAAYARSFLARRGAALLPGDKGYLRTMLADTLPQ